MYQLLNLLYICFVNIFLIDPADNLKITVILILVQPPFCSQPKIQEPSAADLVKPNCIFVCHFIILIGNSTNKYSWLRHKKAI